MEKVRTHTPMVLIITVIGSMINNMDSEWNHGLTVPNTKVTTSTARKKAKENLHSQTEATTKENSNRMRSAVMENITGQMESNMTVNGAIIKCTEKEF